MRMLINTIGTALFWTVPVVAAPQVWTFPPPDLGDPNVTGRNYNDFHLSIFIPRTAVVPDPSLPDKLWTDTGDIGNGLPDAPFELATLQTPPGEVITPGTLGTTIQTDWNWTGANGQANNCASWWEAMVRFDPPLPAGAVVSGQYTFNGVPLPIPGTVTGTVPEPMALGFMLLCGIGAVTARGARR